MSQLFLIEQKTCLEGETRFSTTKPINTIINKSFS